MYICMVSVFVLFVQLIIQRYRHYTHCLETEVHKMYANVKMVFSAIHDQISNMFHVSGQKLTKHFLIDKKYQG